MPHSESVLPLGVPIAPVEPTDVNPTHIAEYGRGGLMSVANSTARSAIPSDRRTVGMLVYQQDMSSYFTLTALPNTWAKLDNTVVTTQSSVLSVDGSLTTSWSDVLTVSISSGTWLVTGGISGSCNSSQQNFSARVYNNTSAEFVASSSMHVEHTNQPHGLSMTGIVSVASTSTISLGAKVSSGTGTAYAASEGAGSKSTTLVAVRIA
jgi:hypothetical protein